MKKHELAARLTGISLDDIPSELNREGSRLGLVVVIGTSADTIEFHGAIQGEADMPEGGTIYFDADDLLPDIDDVERMDEEDQRDYYARKKFAASVDAEWMKDGFNWTFSSVIPHSRFVVLKDGARYCRGIVFSLADAVVPQ